MNKALYIERNLRGGFLVCKKLFDFGFGLFASAYIVKYICHSDLAFCPKDCLKP